MDKKPQQAPSFEAYLVQKGVCWNHLTEAKKNEWARQYKRDLVQNNVSLTSENA